MNKYFDAIYCINLDKRRDGWERVSKAFKDSSVEVIRFSAIEQKDGRIGCIKSHIEILKIAKERNLKNVLIFEDDVVFIDSIVDNTFEQLPMDWETCYIGANLHTNLIKYSDNLFTIKQAFSTHAIAYNNTVFDFIINKYDNIEKLDNYVDIYDVWLSNNIQPRNKSYIIYPLVAIQEKGYSDIENNFIDYSFIGDRYKKFVQL